MGKYFFKPVYLDDCIKFGGTEIPVAEIITYIFDNLYTNKQIAEILSEKTGGRVGPATVAKILKHYNIIIDAATRQKKGKLRAKVTADNLLKAFGVSNVFQLAEIKTKSADTKLAKYGNKNYVNRAKAEQTCLAKYGVENYSSTTECRQKVTNTNMQKFGTGAPAQNPEVMQKIKATCVERYGVDNYWKSEVFKDSQQKKYFETFPNLTDDYKEIYHDDAKLKEFILAQQDKTIIGLANTFGISRASMYVLAAKRGLLDIIDVEHQTSHYETDIINYIGRELCVQSDRTVLAGKELDIYVPSCHLGVEFNGTYWHSSLYKDKSYHLNKSKLAESAGVRLIHIYEYEWENPVMQAKIKMMLNIALGKVKTRIYARQCEVRKITNAEAKVLNNAVHLQGHRDAAVTYGLFFNNELVQLMSFSKTKYNRNLKNDDSWEIIRGCPGSNNIVIGGVSKLFRHFVKDYAPKEVFSYCDFNKFNGKSYEELGMKFIGYTGPDMKWLLKSGQVVNRKPRHHAELKEQSLAQIFGAGSKKYLWKAE